MPLERRNEPQMLEPLGAGHRATGPRRSGGSGTGSAPATRSILPHPAGAPAGRAYQEGEADAAAASPGGLWAIGFEGKSPLRLAEAEHYPHVSLAFDDELTEQQKRDLEEEWGVEREETLHFHKFTSGAAGELSLKWDPVANSESVQRARASSSYSHRPLHISF